MAKTANEYSTGRTEASDESYLFAKLVFALLYLAMTDTDERTEESLLDEMLRTCCLLFSVGTIVLFMLYKLYAGVGVWGIVTVALLTLIYLLRIKIINVVIDFMYDHVGKQFGVTD
jgi:hypothetical protein